ncbi:MAG: hypothetical protein ABSA26_01910 [Thermoguttaceae bacterium]|jgi:hypothetical protein
MQIINSYPAKALVWLAAALLPWDMLLAGACRCGEHIVGCEHGKSVNTISPAACRCHCGAACPCCHQAKKTRQSACCKNRTGNPLASRGAISPLCDCCRGHAPAPQIPPPDSSAAKQLLGHSWAGIAPAAIVELPYPTLHSIGICPSLPANSLARLSNLCRLNI